MINAANFLADIGRIDPRPDDLARLQGWPGTRRASKLDALGTSRDGSGNRFLQTSGFKPPPAFAFRGRLPRSTNPIFGMVRSPVGGYLEMECP